MLSEESNNIAFLRLFSYDRYDRCLKRGDRSNCSDHGNQLLRARPAESSFRLRLTHCAMLEALGDLRFRA